MLMLQSYCFTFKLADIHTLTYTKNESTYVFPLFGKLKQWYNLAVDNLPDGFNCRLLLPTF